MFGKLILILTFSLLTIGGIAQKSQLLKDNERSFTRIFTQDVNLCNLGSYGKYAAFFNASLLVEVTLNRDESILFSKLHNFKLDTLTQLPNLKKIGEQYISDNHIDTAAVRKLFASTNWEKTFKNILSVLLQADSSKVDYCFVLNPPPTFPIDITNQEQNYNYIKQQAISDGVSSSINSSMSACSCSKIGRCDTTGIQILVRGNNWTIGNTLFVAFPQKVINQFQKDYKLVDNTKSFDAFIDSVLHQQFDLEGYKVLIYNAISEGIDLPDYHVDLFFTPFRFNGKQFALLNDSKKIQTWNNPDAINLDSFRTRLVYFEKYVRKHNLADSFLTLPSIYLKEDYIGGDKEFSYANCIIKNTPDSITFYFPSFKKDKNSLKPIHTDCKEEIEIALKGNFKGKAILKFMDFDPYNTNNDGFLHCNFLPIYK